MKSESREFWSSVWGASASNLLESYDFTVYGFVAPTIGRAFFPDHDPTAALLLAFAVFGVGFLARPLGAICFGRLGDLSGRKAAIVASTLVMAAGTLINGLAPDFAEVGVLAPILVVVARLVQGFGAGGGAGNIMVFVTEWAPDGRRGFFAALSQCAAIAGILMGSLVVALCASLVPKPQFEAWAWRVPFLIGVATFPVALFIRMLAGETPVFENARRVQPVAGDLLLSLRRMGRAVGVIMLWTSATYVFLIFMPTFTTIYAHVSKANALWANSISLLVALVATPWFGRLSDQVGRKPVLLTVSATLVILPYPLLDGVVADGSYAVVVGAQVVLTLTVAALFGVCPATVSEIFPTSQRATLTSVSYACAVAIFGGFGPYASAWLIKETGLTSAPAFYVMANAIATGATAMTLAETAQGPLRPPH